MAGFAIMCMSAPCRKIACHGGHVLKTGPLDIPAGRMKGCRRRPCRSPCPGALLASQFRCIICLRASGGLESTAGGVQGNRTHGVVTVRGLCKGCSAFVDEKADGRYGCQ